MKTAEDDLISRALEHRLAARAGTIAATAAQRKAAATSRDHLRELLSTGHMERRLLDDFLIGSYARFTALTPLDDVDMVFVIDPGYWQVSLARLVGQRPPVDKVLESFATATRRRYPATSVRVQRRSIGLLLSKLTIDIVPAIADPSRPDWIYIPDRDKQAWIPSAPKIHTRVSSDVNQRNGNRLKPLVRLLKSWNNLIPGTARLKSFAIETMATRLFSRVQMPSLLDGLELFFDFLSWRSGEQPMHAWSDSAGISLSRWSREVPDIAGTGSNLVQNVDGDRVRAFGTAVRGAREAVVKARRARTADSAWRYLDRRFRRPAQPSTGRRRPAPRRASGTGTRSRRPPA